MAGLLILTLFLVFANGFFVAAEFALVKVRSTQLDAAAADGKAMAATARGLLDHLDSYLSATQLGITLTSLGLGWIGEPAVAHLLEPLFERLDVPESAVHQISFLVGFSLISFLHIVLGEVAPKSLAIARPVSTSMAVALPMRAFHAITLPALWILNASSALVLRLVGVDAANTHTLAIRGDEFVRMAQQSAAEGSISAQEGDLVHKVFAFSNRVARQIMVPRHQAWGIELDEPLAPQLQACMKTGHSRFPVFQSDLDDTVGVLHLKDLLLRNCVEMTSEELRAILRPAMYVPGTLAAETLMRRMQLRRVHMALVVDEAGAVSGLVTMEDALEELVGEIQDEYDHEIEPFQQLEGGGYAVAGGLLLRRLASLLGERAPESRADTLQGYLMEQLERLPKPGDEVPLGSWTVAVREVEDRTVLRAEVQPTST